MEKERRKKGRGEYGEEVSETGAEGNGRRRSRRPKRTTLENNMAKQKESRSQKHFKPLEALCLVQEGITLSQRRIATDENIIWCGTPSGRSATKAGRWKNRRGRCGRSGVRYNLMIVCRKHAEVALNVNKRRVIEAPRNGWQWYMCYTIVK